MKYKIACILGLLLSSSALATDYQVSKNKQELIPFATEEESKSVEKDYIESNNSDFTPYVYGGQTANPKDHKFFARIIIDYGLEFTNLCGASILDDRHILTAAHCVNEFELGIERDYRMRVVVKNPTMSVQKKEMKQIESIQIHEDYGSLRFYKGDVAVIKLKYPIIDNVQSITLPDATDISNYAIEGSNLKIFGLGTVGFNPQPYQVKEADLEYQLDNTCSNFGNEDNVLCAKSGSSSISGDTCQGDSGGPIGYIKNDNYQQVGLTSYGPTDCTTGQAAAYTDIAYYRDWIVSYMFGGNPLTYNESIDDGSFVSAGDGANYNDWYTGENAESLNSGGSFGFITLFGLLLSLRLRKK